MASCPTCHLPIPPKAGRGRPAKYHAGCKPKRRSAQIGLAPAAEGASVVQLHEPAEPDPPSLESVTLADLRSVQRDRSTQGVAALKLARLVDAGGYNAQGAAALVKAHREALEVALEGTTPTADVIDAIFGAG